LLANTLNMLEEIDVLCVSKIWSFIIAADECELHRCYESKVGEIR